MAMRAGGTGDDDNRPRRRRHRTEFYLTPRWPVFATQSLSTPLSSVSMPSPPSERHGSRPGYQEFGGGRTRIKEVVARMADEN